MQTPDENGVNDAAHEVDSLCQLFPEYDPDEVNRAYRAAKLALTDFEEHPRFMHVMQQKLS